VYVLPVDSEEFRTVPVLVGRVGASAPGEWQAASGGGRRGPRQRGAALLVLLDGDRAVREAALEDLERILGSRLRPRSEAAAQRPRHEGDHRAPEDNHPEHHHDPPSDSDVAVVPAPAVGQRECDQSGPLPPKEMGIILGVAVLLDAALVRLLLVPVLLRLMGRWAWYLPRWAHRLLPDVRFGHA